MKFPHHIDVKDYHSRVRHSYSESESETEPRGIRWRRNIVWFFKKFAAFLLSHVGLVSIVVGYMILGGIVFMELEKPYEERMRHRMDDLRTNITKELTRLSLKIYEAGIHFNWTEEADKLFIIYQDELFNATKKRGWAGPNNPHLKWTFPGALLYSVTVITTIGYGNLAPHTGLGRFVTMAYASFGIPLTLLCLSNLGQVLGGFFAIIYRMFISQFFRMLARIFLPRKSAFSKKLGKRLMNESDRADQEITQQIEETETRNDTDQSDDDDGLISTVGSSTNISDDNPNTCVEIDSIHSKYYDCEKANEHQENKPSTYVDINDKKSESNNAALSDIEFGGIKTRRKNSKNKMYKNRRYRALKILSSIPLPMAMFVIVCYITGGAYLFSVWEEQWDYLEGLYFCFITLTTIGFGDYVPGITGETKESQEKRILCGLYIIIGLALLAMCFHLVQEGVRKNMKRAAIKLGIEKKNSPNGKFLLS